MAVAIRDLIPLVLEKQHDWRVALARDWHTIVGTLATRTCLEKIYDDTVIIGVYESHWMQELYLLSSDLKDSINNTLPAPRIKHIRFKLVEEKTRMKRRLLPKKLSRPATVTLSTSQAQALARITDEGLKQALTDFWGRCTVFQVK